MLTQPTIDRLQTMRLDALAAAWQEQQTQPEVIRLGFDERFAMLIDAEWLYRENKRLARCLKEAKLRLSLACVEDIDYPVKRELDRAIIRQLTSCRWVDEHQNVVITGATGTGKTFVACALAQQAVGSHARS
jgi:DNA replication protein DnaC